MTNYDSYLDPNKKDSNINRKKTLVVDNTRKIGIFFATFTLSTVIVMVIAIMNSNIIFLIRNAPYLSHNGKNLLDLWFPSDCKDTPYGSPNEKRPICDNIYSSNNSNNERFSGNELFNKVHKQSNTHHTSWPYTEYNGGDNINPLDDYKNWFLVSLASTNTTTNRHIKDVLYLISHNTNRFVLMIMSFIIFLVAGTMIIPSIIYYSSILFNQVTGIFNVNIFPVTKIAILCTFLLFIWFNSLYSTYESICLLFKLTMYPLFMGGKSEIFNIMGENSDVLGFLIGLAFIISSAIVFNNDSSHMLKISYFVILVGYIIKNKFGN